MEDETGDDDRWDWTEDDAIVLMEDGGEDAGLSTGDVNPVSGSQENSDTTVKYGEGDSIPFSLTAVMPESISAYDTYKLAFHDSLSEGLTYDEDSLKVFVDGVEMDVADYDLSFNGQQFTVTIEDVKGEPYNAVVGSEIVVKYTATLNDSTAFRNINDAYLEYSNNPNGDGMGITMPDAVTAFTFSICFNKVDGRTNDTLAGAGFTLYKKGDDGIYTVIRDEIKDTTSFIFKGLATGDYKLVESTTPDGYNTMEDLEFSILAESMEDADGTAHVTKLRIVAQGSGIDGNNLTGWTDAVDTGVLNTDIANFKGSELPSTGGIGTTMFYAMGGIVILISCVVLVIKKKENMN